MDGVKVSAERRAAEDRWRGDEIGITTILGPSILQGGQEYPLKVHQRQPADRLKSVSTSALSSPAPPLQIRRRNNIAGCYDNRAASRRIASHRAKPPRKLALLHHNDFSLVAALPLLPRFSPPFCTRHRFSERSPPPPSPPPPPSRLEISISGFSARFSGKISVITARTLDVQVSVERAPFPAGCVFLIGVGGGGCPDRIVSRERFYATWTDPSFGFRKRDLLENARKFVENAREGRFFAREAVEWKREELKFVRARSFTR